MTDMEVIPAINCHEREFGCVEEKVRLAETFKENEWIHLDVADGVFTFNKTWNDPGRWKELETSLKLEVHLMVEDPKTFALEWLKAGARRVIIHSEALMHGVGAGVLQETIDRIKAICEEHEAELMVALNPETSIEKARGFFERASGFLVLGVHPGLAGQLFLPAVLEKIRVVRKAFPGAVIETDGGINEETGRRAAEAGADVLVSASYIFGSENPKKAYEMLKGVR